MARMFIVEYVRQGTDSQGNVVPCAEEPGVPADPVDFSGGLAHSEPFASTTRFVMITADAACHYRIGPAATSEADTDDFRLVAGAILFFSVLPGQRLSVIASA